MDSSDDNEEFERRIGDLDRKLRVLEYNLSQASQDTIKDSLTPHQRHIDYLSEYEEEDYDECTLELPFMNKGKKPSTLTSGFKGGELKIEPLIGSLGIPAGIVSLDLNDYDENDFIDYDQDYSDSDEDSDDDSALDNAFNTNYNTDDDSENGDAGGIGGQSNVNGGSRNGKSTNYRDENGNSEHVRHYSGKQDGQNYKANNRTTRPATMPTYKASEPTALKVGNSPIFNPEKRWSDFATQRISELDIDPKTEPKRHSLVLSKSISNSGGFYIAMQDYIPDDTDYIQLLHGDLIKMKTDWGVNLHTLEQGKIDPKYLLGVTAEVVVEMLTKMNISQVVLKDIEGLVDGFDENTNIDTFNPREDPEDIIPIPKLRSYKSSHCIESEDPTLFFCWKEKSDRVAVFGSFNNYEKVVPLFFDSVSKVFVAFCESVQSNGDYCYFRFLVDDVWRTDQSIPQQLVGDEVYNYLLMTCGEIQGRLAITKYEPVRFKILPRMILLDQCEANSSEFNLDSSQIYLAIEELMVINEEFKHLRVDSGISVSSKMIANECTEPLLNSASTLGDIHYACYTYQCKNDGLCYSLSCSKPTLIGTNWNGSSNTSSALKVKRTKPLSLYIPVEPALPGEDDFINRNSLVLGPLVSPTNSNGSDYDMEFGHKSIECLVEDYIKRVDPTYDIYEKLSELGNVLEPSDSSIELLNTDDWYSPTMKGSSGPVDKEFTLDNIDEVDDAEYWDTPQYYSGRATAEEVFLNLRIRQERHLAVYTVRSFRPIILSPISENGELPDFNLTPKEDEINEMLSLSTDLTSSDAFRGDPKTSNNRPTSIDTSLSASLSRKDDTSLLEDLTPKASEYVNNLNLKQNKNNNQIAGFLSVDSDSELDYSLELDYDNADMHSAHILLDIGDIGSKSVFAIIVLVPYLHFFVTPGLFTLLGYSIRIWFYFQYAALYTFVIKETLKA